MSQLVSIIVPCYNQATYLPETLQSVLDQTYTHWECIIVNDGSPDHTEAVALEWCRKDERFVYLKKENGGLSSARNAGIKIAKGAYLQFLDSDDLLEVNKLQWQSQFFDRPIDVLISGYRYFEDKEGSAALRIMGRGNFMPERVLTFEDTLDLKNVFDATNPFVICAPLYKKSVIATVGYFNETLQSLEDWDFNFRCALHDLVFHHTGYSDKAKVLVRLHDSSMMRNKERMHQTYVNYKKMWYADPLYQSYFGMREISGTTSEENNIKLKLKQYLLLFIPPIVVVLKNKLLKK